MSEYADNNLKRRSSISKDFLPATASAAQTTAEWLKKSIRRSWTISNAEDDNGATRDPDVQPYPHPHLPRKQSQSSYPSLVKHPYFNPLSMADEDDYGEEEEGDAEGMDAVGGGNRRPAALRRAMPPRQSTLPNPEGIYYGSNNNLIPQVSVSVSPKQQLSPSPQYNTATSPYQTDNEADNDTGSDHHRSPLAARYKIRRQSTLPCKPNEMPQEAGQGGGLAHGSGPKIMMMSSSPNSRTNLYSKSPERDGSDASMQQPSQRFPPFVRQSTFPSNSNDPFLLQIQTHSSPSSSSLTTQQQGQHQQQQQPRQLPTSPNRLVFNKSPDSGTESGPGASESSGTSPHQGRGAAPRSYQMSRQATLPNPEQHLKLLPTSPPKKQLSPHSIKRSPDFARQNTLPAPQQQQQQQQPLSSATPQSAPVAVPQSSATGTLGGTVDGGTAPMGGGTMNTLSVHLHGPKFMPISPRQKASFLFPQPAAPQPRPFHSQQHFPTHLSTSPSAAAAINGGGVGGGTVSGIGASHSSSTSLVSAAASKMIKVRSHSNEEYTMAAVTRAAMGMGMGPLSEGRRMLPEIPTTAGGGGGNRSPRLVRQEHVRDELLLGCVSSVVSQATNSDKRTTSSSPKQKTFAEAKQTMAAAATEDTMMGYEYGHGDFYDEDQQLSLGGQYREEDETREHDRAQQFAGEPFPLLPIQQQRHPFVPHPVDSSPESVGAGGYGFASRKDRLRSRRKSRDLYEPQDEPQHQQPQSVPVELPDEGVRIPAGEPVVKRKPETMRSISEEAPAAKPLKPVTRRSLSHPEKDTQLYSSKKLDTCKIPSPKPLTELHDRQYKPSSAIGGSATSPRRKNIKSFDSGTTGTRAANLTPNYHPQMGSSGEAMQATSPGCGVGTGSTSDTSGTNRTSGYGGSAMTIGNSSSVTVAGNSAVAGAVAGFQSFGQRKISAFQQILQRQRLQKRDSKSLDIVASKLMEEKYGTRGQEVDVSKSLDDGIFSESAGHQSDDNSSDEHINLTYKASERDNKTTLGEAEIQNAVEAAAVVFKKVVLQRREENKCKTSTSNQENNSPDLTGSPGALAGDEDTQGSSPRAVGPGAGSYERAGGGDGTAPNSGGGSLHKSGGGGSMVSSPVGSAGGGSDNWPSQSDEDIDRLVALHQNRASLSSLGLRSDSMASVYSGAGEGRYGTVTVRGQIELGMQYNYKQGALEIHVKQCRDLAAVDTKRNRSDPYVKVYLLPDKSKSGKRKTKVKKHTLNPVFDEVLRFHMSLNSLQTRTIWLTVWHSDMFGRNDFLGEVMMGLQDKMFDNPQPQWYQLQERSEPFEDLSAYKGDIIIGLKYVSADSDGSGSIGPGSSAAGGIIGSGGSGGVGGGSSGGSGGSGFGTLNLRKFSTRSLTSSSSMLSGHSKGALHVLVKEAKHLQPIKSNGTCDAFCKSYLLPDKNRSSKQKTPVIKRTNSPVWNFTFVYEDVSLAELSERALELTIWDHDRLASNEFLGGVRFSLGNGKYAGRAVEWMDSTGKELSLWQNMINRPNFWVEGALVLRPSLENARFST
uniref:C2 domain-containing protein n=1 Tax=Anopheles atroparvus TaxID=41427 RepID=A0AAG5D090_ANOAO